MLESGFVGFRRAAAAPPVGRDRSTPGIALHTRP
jgi:hypothetical protein